MAIYVTNCPRCNAKEMTFDVLNWIQTDIHYGWQPRYEVFCICRRCKRSTVFVIDQHEYKAPIDFAGKDAINPKAEHLGFICVKDIGSAPPPDHVPPDITKAFVEAARCTAIGAWNGAGAMFRACIGLATCPMLPPAEKPDGPNAKQRRDLGLRLPWLFQHGLLPRDLEKLSSCVHQDGNDAAHAVNLEESDAKDLLEFTTALLQRLFTEPEKIRIAEERREERRRK